MPDADGTSRSALKGLALDRIGTFMRWGGFLLVPSDKFTCIRISERGIMAPLGAKGRYIAFRPLSCVAALRSEVTSVLHVAEGSIWYDQVEELVMAWLDDHSNR